MKGLIYKDLLSLYKTRVLLLTIAIVGCAIMLYFDVSASLFTFLAIFLAMQEISLISPEKACGWKLFQTALPVSRKSAIYEKYFMTLAYGLAGFLIALVVYLISGGKFNEDFTINALICICFLCPLTAVALPLAIRLPISQFFLAMLGGFLIPALVIASWSVQIGYDPQTMTLDMHIPYLAGCAVACVVLMIVSMIVMPIWLSRTDQN